MVNKKTSPKGKSVRVTFQLPAEVAQNSVAVVGDFNDWNPAKHEMSFNKKKGVWTTAISLKPGNTHEFRYIVDGSTWRNDEAADWYTANPYFCENGVIEL